MVLYLGCGAQLFGYDTQLLSTVLDIILCCPRLNCGALLFVYGAQHTTVVYTLTVSTVGCQGLFSTVIPCQLQLY